MRKLRLPKSLNRQLMRQGFAGSVITNIDGIKEYIEFLEHEGIPGMKGDMELYICTPNLAGLKADSYSRREQKGRVNKKPVEGEELYAIYSRSRRDR